MKSQKIKHRVTEGTEKYRGSLSEVSVPLCCKCIERM